MWVWKLIQFVVLKRDQAVAGVQKGSARDKGNPNPGARTIVIEVAHSRVVKRQKKARGQNHITVVIKKISSTARASGS